MKSRRAVCSTPKSDLRKVNLNLNTKRHVHDNRVYAFLVDSHHQRITLYTEFLHQERKKEFTDVVFFGVVAHKLEHNLKDNILNDILEVEPKDIVDENAKLFADSWRWLWPPIEYEGNLQKLFESLVERHVRGYAICSSIGLNGWVLASGQERVMRPSRADFT